MRVLKSLFIGLVGVVMLTQAASAAVVMNKRSEGPRVVVGTNKGAFLIQLLPQYAPKHVAAFVQLAHQGYYDGLYFYHVLPGFLAQAGAPELQARTPFKQRMAPEFSRELTHQRGTVSMVHEKDDINMVNHQFFVLRRDGSQLDGQYTIFGQVVDGMNIVDKLEKADKVVYMKVLPQQKVPASAKHHTYTE